jgi:hypothetical protein
MTRVSMVDTCRARRMHLLSIIAFGAMSLMGSTQTNAQIVSGLGNVEHGHYTQDNNIVYFCVAVRGPFTPQNAQQAFTTAVGTLAMQGISYVGNETEYRTQIDEIWILTGWYNLTINEGGWIAMVNDTSTTSVWFTDRGHSGRNDGWHDMSWTTAGYTITVRAADNDQHGILVGMRPPY